MQNSKEHIWKIYVHLWSMPSLLADGRITIKILVHLASTNLHLLSKLITTFYITVVL